MVRYSSRFIKEINCEVCERPFWVRLEGKKGRRAGTVRKKGSKTCSHICSTKRKRKQHGRKKMPRMIKQRFKRPCKECDELFRPSGKTCRYCEDCLKKPPHVNGRHLWRRENEKSK